jgi:hypothetical protein
MTQFPCGSPARLTNLDYVNNSIYNKIPEAVESKVLNYFKAIKKQYRRPKLFADLPLREGIKLFLYWLIKYESEADIGKLSKCFFFFFSFQLSHFASFFVQRF